MLIARCDFCGREAEAFEGQYDDPLEVSEYGWRVSSYPSGKFSCPDPKCLSELNAEIEMLKESGRKAAAERLRRMSHWEASNEPGAFERVLDAYINTCIRKPAINAYFVGMLDKPADDVEVE